jgi:hypothetical protein
MLAAMAKCSFIFFGFNDYHGDEFQAPSENAFSILQTLTTMYLPQIRTSTMGTVYLINKSK